MKSKKNKESLRLFFLSSLLCMTIWTQSLAKADFGVDVEVFSESNAENYVPSSNKPQIAMFKYYLLIYIDVI